MGFRLSNKKISKNDNTLRKIKCLPLKESSYTYIYNIPTKDQKIYYYIYTQWVDIIGTYKTMMDTNTQLYV